MTNQRLKKNQIIN